MEPAIIAALVAGGVSLVGIIINLLIARQARQATRDQVRLGAAIRAGEEAAKALAAQTAEVERFRIACWELDESLQELTASPGFARRKLTRAAEQFKAQYALFMDSWAVAKGEVPQSQLLDIRGLRHQCKNLALRVASSLDYLIDEVSDGKVGKEIPRRIGDLELQLEELLVVLDMFFARVNSVRLQRFAEVIAAPELIGERTHNTGAAPGRR